MTRRLGQFVSFRVNEVALCQLRYDCAYALVAGMPSKALGYLDTVDFPYSPLPPIIVHCYRRRGLAL